MSTPDSTDKGSLTVCAHCGHYADTVYHQVECEEVCTGQWCCGCSDHPIGKPWGWNVRAWNEHWAACGRNPHRVTASAEGHA